MTGRVVRRSAAAAAALVMAAAGSALADSVAADGDTISPGVQTFVDLGTVSPGTSIERDVVMTLFCSGLRHVDPGQVVELAPSMTVVPVEGGSITATATSVGPVPSGWADDTGGVAGCAGPMDVQSAMPSHVTIVAPTLPGDDYTFSVQFDRALNPAGVADASSVSGFTIVTFVLDVAEVASDTTPPRLEGLPGDLDLVTADPGGAVLEYDPPSAVDDLDPAPTVDCLPAPGTLIPVGSTEVSCLAVDAAGNATSGTFHATVRLATVGWDDPMRGDPVVVTRGRSLPLKARAWLDGDAVAGPAGFEVWSCAARASTPERRVDASWQAGGGRWMAVLDTTDLAPGCHAVVLVAGGHAMGSLELRIIVPGGGGAGTGTTGRGNRPS